ncbi:hypothetical protein ACKAV7_008568 [Fusarium commune]
MSLRSSDVQDRLPGHAERRPTAGEDNFGGLGHRERLSHQGYTVGWICALDIEMTAAKVMLDDIHEALPTSREDTTQSADGINDQRAKIFGIYHMNLFLYKSLVVQITGNSSSTSVALPKWTKDLWQELLKYQQVLM